MRVTSSMYNNGLFGANNSKLNKNLFDVNKQISSGLKIQYAKDDVIAFAETMKLDNELSTIAQVKKSTESGYKISNQTDVILNEFDTTLVNMRTLLLQASNNTQNESSLYAVAKELRVQEEHLKNISNTSINGQFIFGGTAVDIKPISSDGTYNGNDGTLKSFLGSSVQQQYNISGSELFLGEDSSTKRAITTNVIQTNQSGKYNFATGEDNGTSLINLKTSDTIRDMMGDTDDVVDSVEKHHFYIQGTKSDGEAIKTKISMKDEATIDELLKKIGEKFGNTPNLDVVNVSLNHNGQIVIEDKIKGSSKLDFHMVGAVDFDTTSIDVANVDNIDYLQNGEKDFAKIMRTLEGGGTPGLFVKEFVSSGYTSASATATNIEGAVYDKTNFEKKGSSLTSSIPQIVKDYNTSTTPPTKLTANAFATPSTKISDVADLSQGTSNTIAGTQFTLIGTNVFGDAFNAQIDFANTGSTFSLDGGVTNYSIFDMTSNPRTEVEPDKMTYQQLMDVVNMVTTNNLPIPGTHLHSDSTPFTDVEEYDYAIKASNFNANTFLTHDGKIKFEEIGTAHTKASLAIYDSNSGDFTADASVLSFNSNNALTIVDPKTDFFKSIDEMITAVENHKNHPDASSGNARNIGIQNAIEKMDTLQEHVTKIHAKVGSQSNSLNLSKERSELLEISTMTLRSSVIDTDLAEAHLILTQMMLSMEAMYSTTAKVSKLSLVNYL